MLSFAQVKVLYFDDTRCLEKLSSMNNCLNPRHQTIVNDEHELNVLTIINNTYIYHRSNEENLFQIVIYVIKYIYINSW